MTFTKKNREDIYKIYKNEKTIISNVFQELKKHGLTVEYAYWKIAFKIEEILTDKDNWLTTKSLTTPWEMVSVLWNINWKTLYQLNYKNQGIKELLINAMEVLSENSIRTQEAISLYIKENWLENKGVNLAVIAHEAFNS